MIEDAQTDRGFNFSEFRDRYGAKCSLQESSLASEAAIWFGVNEPEIKIFEGRGVGWKDVKLPKNASIFSRMHLTQDQVQELLPYLQHFAETGELPTIPPLVKLAQQAE